MTSVALVGRKRKVSVSLDADLLDALGDEEALSTQLIEALRLEVARRRRSRALDALVDRFLTDEHGPWSDADEDDISRAMGLLGGHS